MPSMTRRAPNFGTYGSVLEIYIAPDAVVTKLERVETFNTFLECKETRSLALLALPGRKNNVAYASLWSEYLDCPNK